MKQLDVQIMGQSYLLGCPEGGEDQFRQAVQRVDVAMCKIRDAGKVRARDRIAVLAALNLAFELSEKSTTKAAPSVLQTQSDSAPALEALVRRLDFALNGDGRLI